VARPRQCFTLSNPVPWQNWMAAYLGYTLRMRTLFRGWPIMVNDTHTRRRLVSSNITADFFHKYTFVTWSKICTVCFCRHNRDCDSEGLYFCVIHCCYLTCVVRGGYIVCCLSRYLCLSRFMITLLRSKRSVRNFARCIGGIGSWRCWLTIVLQQYDVVGWVIWPIKSSTKRPKMCRVEC